jgi:beta-1,4-N-acetylglucosaminyltransferase
LILVTVGMHPSGFERLVKQMDEIAGRIEEEVIIQTGGTNYAPQKAEHFSFATEEELRILCRKARVVVTHGGVGTILNVFQEGASVVVVPRLKKYGEVIDDHQLVFVQELEKQGKITAVYDVQRLEEALKMVDATPPELKRERRLVSALKEYIAQFARK